MVKNSKKMKGGQDESMDNNMLGLLDIGVVQILVALIALYITYKISLMITDREGLIQPLSARKQKIVILQGTHIFSDVSKKAYYTSHFDDNKKNYANILKSQNFNPGAQFTYSMWMKIDSNFKVDKAKDENKVLFVKGIPKDYNSTKTSITEATHEESANYQVACPMIHFSDDRTMIISYNTTNSGETVFPVKFSGTDGTPIPNVDTLLIVR